MKSNFGQPNFSSWRELRNFLFVLLIAHLHPPFQFLWWKLLQICESLKSKYLGKFCTFTVLQEIYINNFTMCWMSDSSFWFHPLLANATASGEGGRKAEINELCLTVIRQWGFCVHCIYMCICNSFLRLVPSLTILNRITTYSSQL